MILPAQFPRSLRVLGWVVLPGVLLMVAESLFRVGFLNIHSSGPGGVSFLVAVISFQFAQLGLVLAVLVFVNLRVKDLPVERRDVVLFCALAAAVVLVYLGTSSE